MAEEEREQAEEEGEEESEEEDSGPFDGVSKMNVPPKMKRLVKYDSKHPSKNTDRQGEEEASSKLDRTYSKPFSLKSLPKVHQTPNPEPGARKPLKRHTESKAHNDSVKTATKSELRKMQIKALPKNLSKPNFGILKEKKVSEHSQLKPKEDSFFKDFDVSRLDFSKYSEHSSRVKDPQIIEVNSKVLEESRVIFFDQLSASKRPKFKRKDNLEISPIVTSEEEEETGGSKPQDIAQQIIENEKRTYSIPFDWGSTGEVEVRSVKYWHVTKIPPRIRTSSQSDKAQKERRLLPPQQAVLAETRNVLRVLASGHRIDKPQERKEREDPRR